MTQSFCDHLLASARAEWDAMQAHRFVTEIERDVLPPEVFHRYLVYEHDFVETAILIFGEAMLKAPGFPQRRWLIGVLRALAEEQIVYFERAFAAVGVAPPKDRSAFPPEVAAFRDGMLGIAVEGSYAEIVTAMLAAEWMYATWCTRVAAHTISDPEVRRWIDLHAEQAFWDQVAWLKAEVEREAAAAPPAGRERLAAIFRRALALEIDFHSAPFA